MKLISELWASLPVKTRMVVLTLVLFLLSLGLAQMAQAETPNPPTDLKIDAPAQGRFQFAPVPELLFTRGIAETLQLGPFQVDPDNRWQPGDFTRASGWHSRRQTRLVDLATGQSVAMFAYDGQTGELAYAGVWSGDVNARLETIDGAIKSPAFRIRVLTPTVVWGNGATSINTAYGWNAVVCANISFTECRSKFAGGSTDAAPLVLFITPGRYENQNWYLGARRFVYVTGDADGRPTLVGDELTLGRFQLWQVRNLNFENSRILWTGAQFETSTTLIVSGVRQCCETLDRNGIFNPGIKTQKHWAIYLWSYESVGMGSKGNGMHAIYLEGRPLSTLEVNNTRWLGSKGCSSVKTTMQNVAVRHSFFGVSETSDISQGSLTHTPIDVPSVSNLVVYGNRFDVWRGSTTENFPGRQGVLHGAIFIRLRKPGIFGSDKPAYPNISWNPPVSSTSTGLSPGGGWSSGPETFVSDAFWTAVAADPITDHENPYGFQRYISFNRFVQLPGSLRVRVLRDDGSHPIKPCSQFGKGCPLRTHALWIERSMSWLYGNTYEGFPSTDPSSLFVLRDSETMLTPEPGAKWPREEPEEFPHLTDLAGELPAWFEL